MNRPWGGPDSNRTNTYILEVNATDDVATPNKIKHFVIVNVINVIEPPSFVSRSAVGSSGENQPGTRSLL